MAGRSDATLTDKQAAVARYLSARAAAPERVRSLAGRAWIAAALNPAPENPYP